MLSVHANDHSDRFTIVGSLQYSFAYSHCTVEAILRQRLPALVKGLCAYEHQLKSLIFSLSSMPPLELCGRWHDNQGVGKDDQGYSAVVETFGNVKQLLM